jgi:acyl-CoA thioesterase-1
MALLLQSIAALLFAFALAGNGARAEPIRIVAYGDSNTAGFGVSEKNTYPSKLERALRAKGYDVEVVNSGVSGDTTTRALRRFDEAVPDEVDIALVFLGRNDVRWGVDPAKTRDNLRTIVGRLRERGVEVIVAGFHMRDFSEIAAEHGATYYPDFFDGVARDGVKNPKYTLFWDIVGHLNAAGYEEIVSRLLPVVETHVVKVFCHRLDLAAMLAPECKSVNASVETPGAVRKR